MIVRVEKSDEIFRIDKAGERHLNIYKGCPIGCPFCYWQSDPSWNGYLYVYSDVRERLEAEIGSVPPSSLIRLSYGPLEKEWRLARSCISLLLEHGMRLVISSDYPEILDDIGMLSSHKEQVKVIIELSKFKAMDEFNRSGSNMYFDIANELRRNGIDVSATVSPVLPGITDVEKIARHLPSIPVHISLLDVRPGTLWGENTLSYVRDNYPELYQDYLAISESGRDPYYESLYEKYKDGKGQIRTDLPFYDTRPKGNADAIR